MIETVALVGSGGFGECWVDALLERGIRIVAAIDPDPVANQALIARLPYAPVAVLSDLAAWQGTADLLIDSAPPEARASRIAAAVAKVERIICAKPATPTLVELDTLCATLLASTTRVAVAMQKRLLPAFSALRELVQSAQFGQPHYVRIAVELDGTFWKPGMAWRRNLAFPSLWEGAIHQTDLLFDWMPDFEPSRLCASAWATPRSAFGGLSDFHATLHSRAGVTAEISARWSVKFGPITHYFSGVRIDFERASAEVRDGCLYINGDRVPLQDDGETCMDLAVLNGRLLDLLSEQEGWTAWSLERHRKVLAMVSAIEEECRAGMVAA